MFSKKNIAIGVAILVVPGVIPTMIGYYLVKKVMAKKRSKNETDNQG